MATLVSLSGFQYGVAADETGINIEAFGSAMKPTFKEFVPDRVNEPRGFAAGDAMGEYSVNGEISAGTGLYLVVATTAFVPANTINYFGMTQGGLYCDSMDINETRSGFKTGAWKFTRNKNIA